jgi:hypothetical protein
MNLFSKWQLLLLLGLLALVMALVVSSGTTGSSSTNSLVSSTVISALRLKRHRRLSWISDGAKEGLASALATTVAKAVLQPLDTIKTVQVNLSQYNTRRSDHTYNDSQI